MKWLFSGILFMELFFFLVSAHGESAHITQFEITNTRDDLICFFKVADAFRQNIKNAILSGVPTSFSFNVTLEKVRPFWQNQVIADIHFTHTISYNNLKKNFSVTRTGKNTTTITTPSFNEARKLMTEIENLTIAPMSMLKKGKQYQINCKAKLSKMTLPLYLHYIFFFVSLWDFETDWYTLEFIY